VVEAVSNVRLVSPSEALELLERGYTYVDVRSELEFSRGHPPGAFNIPLMYVEGDRLVDNPEFIDVMLAVFRTTDPLLIGCHSGTRSHTAVVRSSAAGFSVLAELRHGFNGARDAFGRRLPGWVGSGLPVELSAPDARTYAALRLLPRLER
jgi:rhodanese-related sulfurtransferase